MKPSNFSQVTIFDFAKMEGKAVINKTRVVGHEGIKMLRGEQTVLTTIGAVAGTIFAASEEYYDFPPPGNFHIERGY